jgi:transcriptional regulator with XRE-family HTH domain
MPKAHDDSDANNEDVNELRAVRKRMKLTQAQIAERVEISRSLWSALENRQRPLTVALLNRMATRLELSDADVKSIREWWGESHLMLGSAASAA